MSLKMLTSTKSKDLLHAHTMIQSNWVGMANACAPLHALPGIPFLIQYQDCHVYFSGTDWSWVLSILVHLRTLSLLSLVWTTHWNGQEISKLVIQCMLCLGNSKNSNWNMIENKEQKTVKTNIISVIFGMNCTLERVEYIRASGPVHAASWLSWRTLNKREVAGRN